MPRPLLQQGSPRGSMRATGEGRGKPVEHRPNVTIAKKSTGGLFGYSFGYVRTSCLVGSSVERRGP